jgi:Predicted glycosyltransferases
MDQNMFGSQTPRMDTPYISNEANFGSWGKKPPVTANSIFTRAVYETVGGFDPDFIYTWDDYEWFYRVVQAGYPILCTPLLTAEIHHRERFGDVLKAHVESGRGTAQFIHKHPRSLFARRRKAQMLLVWFGLLSALRFPRRAGGLGVSATIGLGAISALRTRRVEAMAYPAVTLVLGAAYSAALTRELLVRLGSAPRSKLLSSRRLDVESRDMGGRGRETLGPRGTPG